MQQPPHEVLYWRFKPQWAVREGSFKLLSPRGASEPMLVDLSSDPGEQTDLSKQKPEAVQRLRAKYDAWDAQLMEPKWEGRQEGARFEEGKQP